MSTFAFHFLPDTVRLPHVEKEAATPPSEAASVPIVCWNQKIFYSSVSVVSVNLGSKQVRI